MSASRFRLRVPMLAFAILAFFLCTPALADDLNPNASTGCSPQFIRVRFEHEVPVALETAVVRFAAQQPKQARFFVDLVATIHIADHAYYQRLNKLLEQYDVVLFELVADPQELQQTPDLRNSSNPVSTVQRFIASLLGLSFQLDAVDYSKPNFVHADLSPDQLAKAMQQRNENLLKIWAKLLSQTRSNVDSARLPTDWQFLLAMLSTNRTLHLKRLLAQQLATADQQAAALAGGDGLAILNDRNEVAFNALQQQLRLQKRKVAILFGAAHMPHLAQLLRERLNLRPVQHNWLVAWNLKPDS